MLAVPSTAHAMQVKYTIKSGDSLSKIAESNGTTWQDLHQKNPYIVDPNLIYPNKELLIKSDDAPASTPAPTPAPVAAPAPKPVCNEETQWVRADNGQCLDKIKPAPQPAPAAQAVSAPVSSGGVVSGCGDNDMAHYIYMHESGCNTAARNSGGCLGIGQACPGSKLTAVCPSLDYACENAFFTNYANSRYGGWAGAYQFWLNNKWW